MTASPATALIIVDVQYDFLPQGSLAVDKGHEIINPILSLLDGTWNWSSIIVSQDYHPPGHISFASAHPGHEPFTTLDLTDARGKSYTQTLWPDHCIIGTHGVEVHDGVWKAVKNWQESHEDASVKLVRKGWHAHVEAYSAFEGYLTTPLNPADPPLTLSTGAVDSELVNYLVQHGIQHVIVTGLATDFCVAQTTFSALSSDQFISVSILAPAVRAISFGDAEKVFEKVEEMGGRVIGRGHCATWTEQVQEELEKVVPRV